MKRGKRYLESEKLVDSAKQYESSEAMDLVVQTAKAKFDETVEIHVKLGVDSRHADQQVRGAVVLPHGTGKTTRVLVFAKGDKADEAKAAGADYVGADDLIPKIQNENWFEFDVVVATPDMMGVVGRLGRVLGLRVLCLTLRLVPLQWTLPRQFPKSRQVKSSIDWIRQILSTARWVRYPSARKS